MLCMAKRSVLRCLATVREKRRVIAAHIHDALAQVRRLQELILQKRLFRGYSGKARLASGAAALAGTLAMASPRFPATPQAHLAGWSAVLAAGVLFNYGFLLRWFLFDPAVRRNPAQLKPALDALPALGVGAALTAALLLAGQFDLLFGAWMSLYGLAQVAYRQSLPTGIYAVGLGYILCGAGCLLSNAVSFLSPWPMGIVFVAGELAGGFILLTQETRAAQEDPDDDERPAG
jgi:hypothetical protein